jgi:hypothetical protein
MKARNIVLWIGDTVDRLADPAVWLGAAFAFVVVAYLLTAPPILLAHAKQTGGAFFPGFYGPVERLIESDFGGPMVWYFNSVSGCWPDPDRGRRGTAMVHHSLIRRVRRRIAERTRPAVLESVAQKTGPVEPDQLVAANSRQPFCSRRLVEARCSLASSKRGSAAALAQ